jgi:hydroxyacylglutathione hydrolase
MMNESWKEIDGSWPVILHIPGDNEGKYPNSNSMLIRTSKESNAAILIDCGIGARIARKLRKDFSVTRVLLSHWHEDHTASLRFFKDARVSCHPADIPPLTNMDAYKRAYGIDGTAIEQQFISFVEAVGVEPVKNVEILATGQFQEGEASIQVIHAPGHSAGHCCFYEPRRKVAFLSDIDLSKFGPWYGCRDSSLVDFVRSVRVMRALDIDIAASSHEGITEGKAIKDGLDYFLKKIDDRDNKILSMLREKSPIRAIDIYGHNLVYRNYDKFGDYLRLAEAIMVDQHLESLLRAGKIARNGDGFTLA